MTTAQQRGPAGVALLALISIFWVRKPGHPMRFMPVRSFHGLDVFFSINSVG
ncbi:hypothetical protein [Rhizobium sp. SYY.PMSO]|uniref:hypothetical protein n=1 Tax=Rhizobium sp. SYY.PMSO TaxID=3382192 RepID=UPI00398F9198